MPHLTSTEPRQPLGCLWGKFGLCLMTLCLQLAAPALGCQPGGRSPREASAGVEPRPVGTEGVWVNSPLLLLGSDILEIFGCFLGCSRVGPLCNGCPVGDARGSGTLELPPPRAQEQTQPDASTVPPKTRLRDAQPVSALLPAPPPAAVSVPDECCCDRSSEGEREARLAAGASRRSAGNGPRPRSGGAEPGGRGGLRRGTRSCRYGGLHLERSRWPWGERGSKMRSIWGRREERRGVGWVEGGRDGGMEG